MNEITIERCSCSSCGYLPRSRVENFREGPSPKRSLVARSKIRGKPKITGRSIVIDEDV